MSKCAVDSCEGRYGPVFYVQGNAVRFCWAHARRYVQVLLGRRREMQHA